MLIYIFFGIVLILFSVLEVCTEIKYKKIFYFILAIAIYFFIMTRGYVGWDWVNYEPDYYLEKSKFEIGYAFFSKMVKFFKFDFEIFTIINSLVNLILVMYIFPKYTRYPIFSLFLYFTVHGLALEVDILRNSKSIFLFLLSLKYLKDRKIYIYFLLNCIGATFHITSLIYLPLYFVLDKKIKKRYILSLVILGMVYYFSNWNIWLDLSKRIPVNQVQGYLKVISEVQTRKINVFFLERVLLMFLIFLGDIYLDTKQEKYYNVFKNSIFIGIIIFLFFSELSIVSLRIMLLFSYAYWFFIPLIIQMTKEKLKIIIFVLGIMIGIFRGYNFLSFPTNKIMYSYENILWKKSNFQDRKEVLKSLLKYRENVGEKELLLQY
ncbi:MAG: EpsG family protein [Fusobacteriaceae bacterium]